ncbi:hypothetical protein [Breoghania sp. L-A4]|nr:hypothetical protein [Breoghania sp. L-A4]
MKPTASVTCLLNQASQEQSVAYGFAMAAALWSMIIAASVVC